MTQSHNSAKYWIIVPARMASTRLPGKPLADIAGTPMVVRVLAIAQGLVGVERAIVATDDDDVYRAVTVAGGRALMSSPDHQSGTDRAAECADHLGLSDDEILVNLQGDEPLLPPDLVQQTATALLAASGAEIATLACPVGDAAECDSPSAVKVVLGDDGRALYFSRHAIPYRRDAAVDLPTYRHIGLYAYRVAALRRLASLPVSALERAEGLEQLRALAAGIHIHVTLTDQMPPAGVDTPEDLARVQAHVRARSA